MIEQIRAVLQAAGGIAEVPRKRAEELARELAGDSGGRGPVASLAEEIMKRGRENAGMVSSLVSSEIRRQIKALGLATRDDLERLQRRMASSATASDIARIERRLDSLERQGKTAGAGQRRGSGSKSKGSKKKS